MSRSAIVSPPRSITWSVNVVTLRSLIEERSYPWHSLPVTLGTGALAGCNHTEDQGIAATTGRNWLGKSLGGGASNDAGAGHRLCAGGAA